MEEVGLDQVRYRTNSAGDQVLIVVAKKDLWSVILKGGQAYTFRPTSSEEMYGEAFLERKHSHAFFGNSTPLVVSAGLRSGSVF